MATPNLANITTITPQTLSWAWSQYPNPYITGSGVPPYSILQNPAGSNTVYKINTIILTTAFSGNERYSLSGPLVLSGTVPATSQYIGSAPTDLLNAAVPSYFGQVTVAGGLIYQSLLQGTVSILSKTPIYLLEGNVVTAVVFQYGTIVEPYSVLISYEIIG